MRALASHVRALHQPVRARLKLQSKVPLLHVAGLGIAHLSLQIAAQTGGGAKFAARRLVEAVREWIAHKIFGSQTTVKRRHHNRNRAIACVVRDDGSFYGDISNAVAAADNQIRQGLVGQS